MKNIKNILKTTGTSHLLTIVFVLAKVFGITDESWIFILAPTWIPFIICPIFKFYIRKLEK